LEDLLETVIEYFRDNPRHERTVNLKSRVGVHFDQVYPEFIINHKVIPEKLFKG